MSGRRRRVNSSGGKSSPESGLESTEPIPPGDPVVEERTTLPIVLLAGSIALSIGAAVAASISRDYAPAAWIFSALNAIVVSLLFRLSLPRPATLPATIHPSRTIEDVERQVEDLEERGRKLRASYQETAAALRQSQSAVADLQSAQRILVTAIESPNPDEAFTTILRTAGRMFHASSSALWLVVDPARQAADLCASTGALSTQSLEPLRFGAGMQPSDFRRAGELIIADALGIALEPMGPDDIIDDTNSRDSMDSGPLVMGAVIREGRRILGVIGLAADAGRPFRPDDRARLSNLVPILSSAVVGIIGETSPTAAP